MSPIRTYVPDIDLDKFKSFAFSESDEEKFLAAEKGVGLNNMITAEQYDGMLSDFYDAGYDIEISYSNGEIDDAIIDVFSPKCNNVQLAAFRYLFENHYDSLDSWFAINKDRALRLDIGTNVYFNISEGEPTTHTPYENLSDKDKVVVDNIMNGQDDRLHEFIYEGRGLDKLMEHPDYQIRKFVANRGYGLDKLIDDENIFVRAEVAEQGYGIDKLIDELPAHRYHRYVDLKYDEIYDDYDIYEPNHLLIKNKDGKEIDNLKFGVMEAVGRGIENSGCKNFEEWVLKHPDRCVLPEEKHQDLIYKTKMTPYAAYPARKNLGYVKFDNLTPEDRKIIQTRDWNDPEIHGKLVEFALEHKGLDALVSHDAEFVRCLVANQGFGLDQLEDDISREVQCRVVDMGYDIPYMYDKADDYVKEYIVSKGYGINGVLSNYEFENIKKIDLGMKLEILDDEPSAGPNYNAWKELPSIKKTAYEYLVENDYKDVKDWCEQKPGRVVGLRSDNIMRLNVNPEIKIDMDNMPNHEDDEIPF